MDLDDLEVYKLAQKLSEEAWKIYETLDRETKRLIGYQFVQAIDSIGANIAEGFGRFHFLDKNKFNYNARGSLFEARHWLTLLMTRKKITPETFEAMHKRLNNLAVKLNNYIKSTKDQKDN
jgi:four helix bundle protein